MMEHHSESSILSYVLLLPFNSSSLSLKQYFKNWLYLFKKKCKTCCLPLKFLWIDLFLFKIFKYICVSEKWVLAYAFFKI